MGMRNVHVGRSPLDFVVDDDPKGVLGELLLRSFGRVKRGGLSVAQLLALFAPDGEGFTEPELLSSWRVEEPEDSVYGHQDNPPDYGRDEFWAVRCDNPRGAVELSGDELRHILRQSADLYVAQGWGNT